MNLKTSIKRVIGPTGSAWVHQMYCYKYLFRYYRQVCRRMFHGPPIECPVCGKVGKARAFGHPPRYRAECISCGSLERHRLFYLALERLHPVSPTDNVLHFAPEKGLSQHIRKIAAEYRTADYLAGHAELILDIEHIDLPDKSVDVVIANHVLEHVDDMQALREIWRILTDHGRLIVSVPIAAGLAKTYENPSITDREGRELHFGQTDHVRWYGRDFEDRLLATGFSVKEFGVEGEDAVQYALWRDDSLYLCKKTSK